MLNIVLYANCLSKGIVESLRLMQGTDMAVSLLGEPQRNTFAETSDHQSEKATKDARDAFIKIKHRYCVCRRKQENEITFEFQIIS